MFCVLHQVPDGATVALVPRHTKHIHHDNHDYVAGESEFTCGLLVVVVKMSRCWVFKLTYS